MTEYAVFGSWCPHVAPWEKYSHIGTTFLHITTRCHYLSIDCIHNLLHIMTTIGWLVCIRLWPICFLLCHATSVHLYLNSYLWGRFIRRFVGGNLLQQLSHSSLFILFPLTFHVVLSDLGHDELGDLETTHPHTKERFVLSTHCTILHNSWKNKSRWLSLLCNYV